MIDSHSDQWVSPIWKEFWELLKRDFVTQFRNIPLLIIISVQTLVVSIMISIIFYQMPLSVKGIQNRMGLLFFLPINQTFTIVMPLVFIFSLDRAVILKERASATYRTSPAFLSKFLSLLPLRLVMTTIFSFIVYKATGLKSNDADASNMLIFWCLLSIHTLCATVLGMAIAAAVPSIVLGTAIGSLIIVIFLLFGGSLVNSDTLPKAFRWIQYTSLIYYCYQGLISNEMRGLKFDNVVEGEQVLKDYSLDQFNWKEASMAMLALTAAFLLFGYIALRISTKPKLMLH